MTRVVCKWGLLLPLLLMAACNRSVPPVTHAAAKAPEPSLPARREVRVTGLIQAVRSTKVLVPQIWGQGGPMTLTRLIPNGSRVKEGDLI
ncbi:MAG: HlyD family secretion protein, partial [Acidobacteriota bacterium]|nr:HlyD family secretion protein [Acidobacteriota bacterium]